MAQEFRFSQSRFGIINRNLLEGEDQGSKLKAQSSKLKDQSTQPDKPPIEIEIAIEGAVAHGHAAP